MIEPSELLTTNLELIERTIAFACRRYRLDENDCEEFGAIVKLKLVENDYAILRAYEARSSLATFISIVVQRMALDYRIHNWGKWHPSAEASRLGALAIDLDRLLHRDGRSREESFVILSPKHRGLTPEALQKIADRLPERAPRRRDVEVTESVAVTRPEAVEEPLMARDRRSASERLSVLMAAIIESMPEEERLILQLRFEGGMAVSQIARALRLDQKLLYRRLDRRMRDIRTELERSGMAAGEVLDLIGRDENLIGFDFGKQISRPSIAADEKVAIDSETPQ
jgi:RNA polymerase sigma factor for flagellar operon FliA